jgi:hypothetical protein
VTVELRRIELGGVRRALAVIGFVAVAMAAGTAYAQNEPAQGKAANQAPSSPPPPVSLANAYRGMFVCEQAPGAADILHVPLDIAVRGSEVQFARPLLNLRGTRVLGSELGDGSVDASGKIHMTSTWEYSGITVRGDYSGTLTPGGGTLTGAQSWHGPDGIAHSRTCQAALVPAANAQHAAAK